MNPRRAASCAKAWQPSNYVCLSCRHQFITRQAVSLVQTNSFSVPSSTTNDDTLSSLAGRPLPAVNSNIQTNPPPNDRPPSISLVSPLPDQDANQPLAEHQSRSERDLDGKYAVDSVERGQNAGLGSKEEGKDISASAEPAQTVAGMSIADALLRNRSGEQASSSSISKPSIRIVKGRTTIAATSKKDRIDARTTSRKITKVAFRHGTLLIMKPSRAGIISSNKQARAARLKRSAHISEAREKSTTKAGTNTVSEEVDTDSKTSKTPGKAQSSKQAFDKTAPKVDLQEGAATVTTILRGRRRAGRRTQKSVKAAPEARKGQSDEALAKSKSTKRTKGSKTAADTTASEDASTSRGSEEHQPLWQVVARLEASGGKSVRASQKTSERTSSQASGVTDTTESTIAAERLTLHPSALKVTPLDIPQPAVPGLEYGLDRVLFNPGVYQLQDPLSRVHNFDPYLQKIMPVAEFDFNALKEYKTSSRDTALASLAEEHDKRYIGSTSSMTGTLAHFHFLLSAWRPVNTSMLSRGFSDKLETFTRINRAPNAMFLRWKNGTYAIDADKEYDSGNVLMLLGKSMEKLLTMPTSEYERYRKSDPREVSEEERTAPEAYQYTTMGDFLMRSQLDAYDPRLPGTGMFDLKTRAVLSVRMDAEDFEPMTGYEIQSLHGRFASYEREYYDMIRSTMLKYMLQARMGRMDGIFVAYHNVERIFGFQYLPMQELDRALHGQLEPFLGDQEFKASVKLLNDVLDKATAKFPGKSLRLHFETSPESSASGGVPVMWIFAEPMEEEQIERIQATAKEKIEEFEGTMMGVEKAVEGASKVEASPELEWQNESATTSDPPITQDAASYASSQSDTDPNLIESITASSSQAKAPLFAASLVCRSHVNGISHARPVQLKATDSWEIEYILREWEDPDAMWARYDQTKARRKEIFDKYRSEEGEDAATDGSGEAGPVGEITSKNKRDRQFIEFLRSMSARGREFRNRIDELERGKMPVVVGQPVASPLTLSEVGAMRVDSVDDYLGLLYEGKS